MCRVQLSNHHKACPLQGNGMEIDMSHRGSHPHHHNQNRRVMVPHKFCLGPEVSCHCYMKRSNLRLWHLHSLHEVRSNSCHRARQFLGRREECYRCHTTTDLHRRNRNSLEIMSHKFGWGFMALDFQSTRWCLRRWSRLCNLHVELFDNLCTAHQCQGSGMARYRRHREVDPHHLGRNKMVMDPRKSSCL